MLDCADYGDSRAAHSGYRETSCLIRVLGWFCFGVFVIGLAGFTDVNRLLADIHPPGTAGFDSSVFTTPELPLGSTERLKSAADAWENSAQARRLVAAHAIIDFVFTIAYCILLFLVLWWLRPDDVESGCRQAIFLAGIPLSILIADELENYLVFSAFRPAEQPINRELFTPIHWVSIIKWFAIAIAAVAVIYLSFRPSRASIRRAHEGSRQHPLLAMNTTWIIAVLLFALVALPAGGPLEQMPDVIREQATPGNGWLKVALSIVSVSLLTAAVAISGLASTASARGGAPTKPLSSAALAPFVVMGSALLFLLCSLVDQDLRWPALAATVLFLFVVLAGGVASGLGAAPSAGPAPSVSHHWSSWAVQDLHWAGAAAGLIVVSVGLGFVRAAFPLVILSSEADFWWWIVFGLGALASLFGGLLVQQSMIKWRGLGLLQPFSRRWKCQLPLILIVVPVILLCVAFAVEPRIAGAWGTPGVVAIAFSAITLLFGALKYLSNTTRPWRATTSLGFARSPWPLLLVLVWITSTILNEEGVYHDIRTLESTPTSRDTVSAAFDSWVKVQPACARESGVKPLVLVAAPGGGIRAAYWTAVALDQIALIDRECAKGAIFAISGVSGGSVGATTWLRAQAVGTSGADEIRRMSRDDSLAAAMSGLLVRDLFQPFIGLSTSWRDRSALLEDGWRNAASPGIFQQDGTDIAWSRVREGGGWMPHLVLNSSSVTDGCRLFLSTLSGLPANPSQDCFSSTMAESKDVRYGAGTGAADPLVHLAGRPGPDGCSADRDIRITTAALLSARFPLVSSSGAIFQCNRGRSSPVIYAVDGGYYENTGMLTIQQIWEELKSHVALHNEKPGGVQVIPWIVVLDNHYQLVEFKTSRRPKETIAPFRTLGNGRLLFGPGALLQSVEYEIRRFNAACPKAEGGVVVVRPDGQPLIAAPLGWSLSELSATTLREQARSAVTKTASNGLLQQLRGEAITEEQNKKRQSCVDARTPRDSSAQAEARAGPVPAQ